MINNLRPILLLIIIYILLLSVFYLYGAILLPTLPLKTFTTLLTVMVMITLGAYLLAHTGIKRGSKEQGVWLLAGLGGKFLAYLVLLLVYWAVGKNLSRDFIIAFFVLYLLLTIFLIGILYKSLKNN